MAYRFTWVIPGLLAGMALPGRFQPMEADLDDLAAHGIRHIVTLIEEELPLPKGEGFFNYHLPIADFSAPDTNQTAEFCRLVDQVREQQGGVVVHCLAGIGRTGTMLAAYLMWDQDLTAQQALSKVRGLRREYVQSVEQEAFLDSWGSHLRHATRKD